MICSWCGKRVSNGSEGPDSHGICPACYVEQAMDFVEVSEPFEGLEFGIVQLDEQCRVVCYGGSEPKFSGLEPEAVLGRHFFDDVAPCADNAEFRGRLEKLRRAESGRVNFPYTFPFVRGEFDAQITLIHHAARGRSTILVERA